MKETIILNVDFIGADDTIKKSLSLSRTIKDLSDEKRKLAKDVKNLDATTSNYDDELNKLLVSQNDVNAKLKVAKKEFSDNERAVIKSTQAQRGNEGSLKQLRLQLAGLINGYDTLTKEQRENTQVGGRQLKSITALDKEVKKIEQSTNRFQGSVGKYSKALKGLGRAAAGAMGAFIAIKAVIEAFSFFKEFAEDIGDSNKLISEFTDGTGESVKALSNLSLAISQTFGKEQKEVLVAANSLSKQMGISFEDALNKINLGFAAGLDANGEFLKQITEYPTLLKEVGLTADETFNIISQSVKSGVYSDKGLDAIKEAGLALRELTPVTRDALDGIGLSSKAIESSLASGTKSVIDIIKEVSTQMGTLPPQSAAVGTAIADIFKGAGEDAGLAYLLTLKDINSEFNEQTLKLNEAQLAQLELSKANEELNSVFNKYFGDSSIGFQRIKAFATSFLADGLTKLIEGAVKLSNGFINIYNSSLALRYTFSSIVSVIKTVQKVGEYMIDGLIRQFTYFADLINSVINLDFDNIEIISKKLVADQTESAKKLGGDIYDTFADGFEATKDSRLSLIEFKPDEVKSAKKKIEEVGKSLATAKTKAEKEVAEKALKEAQKQQAKIADQTIKDNESLIKTIEQLEQEALIRSIDNKQDAEIRKLEFVRDARKKEISETLADEKSKQGALLLLDEEFEANKKEIELKKKEVDDKTQAERRKEFKLLAIDSAKLIGDAVLQNQGRRLEQESKREIEALNLRKQAGTISEEEFAKAREEIDRKAFKKKKALDTKQVIINGLVGAAKTIANLGFPAALPALIGVGVQTATQVAGIQSQSFADGGFTGNSNQSKDSTGEKPVGTVHEKEFVASRRTLATPRGLQMANQLNSINKNPSLGSFADGGFTSSVNVSTEGIERSISKALTNMRVINVATDTSKVDSRVKKIQNKGRI
tara:strand:+ start:8230 stop:11043 length:2814 start_codon:yes stop_codon:yes gene_type:complete